MIEILIILGTLFLVHKASKDKTLKERFNIVVLGTKIITGQISTTFFALVLILTTYNATQLLTENGLYTPLMDIGMTIIVFSTLIFYIIIFYQKWFSWLNELVEKAKIGEK